MPHDIHPAEELYELRARIRALKSREAALRAFFLETAEARDLHGPGFQVSVRPQRSGPLPEALPLSLAANPRFWRDRARRVVRVRRLGAEI